MQKQSKQQSHNSCDFKTEMNTSKLEKDKYLYQMALDVPLFSGQSYLSLESRWTTSR